MAKKPATTRPKEADLTLEALMQELAADAKAGQDNRWTTKEIAEHLGVSRPTARERIERAILDGKVEYAGQKIIISPLNPRRPQYCPSFRPVKKAK